MRVERDQVPGHVDAVSERPSAPAASGPLARLRARVSRVLPWLSLCIGVASGLLMDRSPERAKLVAAAAVGLLLCSMAAHFAMRLERSDEAPVPGTVARVARVTSLIASQSLVQLSLFFSLPFYWNAATLDAGHGLFLLALAALAAVTLWDPWMQRLLAQRVAGALLPSVASFAALNAVLPGVGLSTRVSLWLSATVAAAGVPALLAAGTERGQRMRVAVPALLVALSPMLALYLGAARVIPAAPLRLVRAEIGTERAGRWIAEPVEELRGTPPQLICATAIWSPVGLKDRLYHVWEKNGRHRARIELDIVGGRAGGYRTQSRISHFGKHAAGDYRCRVETAAGQVLGGATVRVRP